MPTRLRTLPDRHGGRVVLGLLIAVLALGLALRVQAALHAAGGPRQRRRGVHADRRGAVRGRPLRRPRQASPNDWSPGAPLLYGAVYFLTGGVHVKAALLLVALLGTGDDPAHVPARAAARGPGRGPVGGAAGRDLPGVHRQHAAGCWPSRSRCSGCRPRCWRSCGRPTAGARGAGCCPGALLGLTDADPARVPAVRGGVRRARARCASPGGTRAAAAPACRPGSRRRALLVAAFCGVLAPWTVRNCLVLDRFVPVTTGGGKALFVATYLPGDGRQQLVKRALIEKYRGKKDLAVRGRARHPDGAAARPRREEVPATCRATPRWRGSAARTSPSTRASSRSTTPGW